VGRNDGLWWDGGIKGMLGTRLRKGIDMHTFIYQRLDISSC
jgi:hypothetical protein